MKYLKTYIATLSLILGFLTIYKWNGSYLNTTFANKSGEGKSLPALKESQISFPKDVASICFLSEADWVIMDSNRQIWKASNSGMTWKIVYGTDEATTETSQSNFACLRFIDARIGYALVNGILLKSNDGGETWKVVRKIDFVENGLIKSIFFVDEKKGWACGFSYDSNDPLLYRGEIWKSVDGGLTWYKSSNNFSNKNWAFEKWSFNDIFFVNADIGWAVGEGGVFLTRDGGINWRQINNVKGDQYKHVKFISEDLGWITVDNKDVLTLLSDSGTKMKRIERFGIDDVLFINESNGFIFDNRGFIFQTNDTAQSWQIAAIPDDKWNELVNAKALGNIFAGKGFDQSIVVLWDAELTDSNGSASRNTIALISKDNGITWQKRNVLTR